MGKDWKCDRSTTDNKCVYMVIERSCTLGVILVSTDVKLGMAGLPSNCRLPFHYMVCKKKE